MTITQDNNYNPYKEDIMTFKEYIPLAQRTNPDLGSPVLNSVHMSMGMASETYELVEAFGKEDEVNVGEEIADKLWYLAGYITVNKLDLDFEFKTTRESLFFAGEQESTGADMVVYESMLLDFDKKWLAYGKTKDMGVVKQVVTSLFKSYNNLILTKNIDASLIMSNNINKLKIRFPDKFTTENAINRDLESERRELENEV
jgi:hypothetical protein